MELHKIDMLGRKLLGIGTAMMVSPLRRWLIASRWDRDFFNNTINNQ